jgi:hypothetical protein
VSAHVADKILHMNHQLVQGVPAHLGPISYIKSSNINRKFIALSILQNTNRISTNVSAKDPKTALIYCTVYAARFCSFCSVLNTTVLVSADAGTKRKTVAVQIRIDSRSC